MARWIAKAACRRVLEPSMGDGQFIRALRNEAQNQGASLEVWGVELAHEAYIATLAEGLLNSAHAINLDFLTLKPFTVDAVIGNPPYVRLRHLPRGAAEAAINAAERVLGQRIDPSGSIWMPFVLHATEFLTSGGRLAFVLPYDFTYVRYARPLWRFLASHFCRLRIARIHERVFPDILQDVVLFFAEGYGQSTDVVEFQAFDRASDLVMDHAARSATLPVARIESGGRPFLEALLPDGLQRVLANRFIDRSIRASDLVTFNIGYVSGDKSYFHPPADVIERFGIPESSLVSSVTSSRRTSRAGLRTSDLPKAAVTRLFLPPADQNALTKGQRDYVQRGLTIGIARRYKCRVRDPWYVTPGVKFPDVLIPVFAESPLLLLNDGGYAASNSMLCGYTRACDATSIAAAWYTSLTLLQVELNVHSLGGGVMVFVPNEAGSIRLVSGVSARAHLPIVDAHLREGRVLDAYASGDDVVLREALGLTDDEVELVALGVRSLRHWRSARIRRMPLSRKHPRTPVAI